MVVARATPTTMTKAATMKVEVISDVADVAMEVGRTPPSASSSAAPSRVPVSSSLLLEGGTPFAH